MAESYWNAKNGAFLKCPVDGCNHIGMIITKAHCRLEHGMTREEVRKKYGLPKNVSKLNPKQVEMIREKQKLLGRKGESWVEK